MEKKGLQKKSGKIFIIRVISSLFILLLGVAVMAGLASMKKVPEKKAVTEKPLEVEMTSARFEDVPLFITGYGEVKSLKSVSLSPEVTGVVDFIHPNLRVGGIINKGEVYLKL